MSKFATRFFLGLIIPLLGLCSCVTGNDGCPEDLENPIDGSRTVLQISVRPLDASTDNNAPAELLKSLRVIIINKGDTEEDPEAIPQVEFNTYLQYTRLEAAGLRYSLSWPTMVGPKEIFVIANEESITANLSEDADGSETRSITEVLDSYPESSDATDLQALLHGYSFIPDYSIGSDNSIYLPYTYHYDNLIPNAGTVTPVHAWLSPVATKFIFNFTNYRDAGVKVRGISMAYTNSENYLFARVGEDQEFWESGDDNIYWPDWLAGVSSESWNYPDFSPNEEFNKRVGWITQYSLPNPADYAQKVFIEEDGPDIFTVPPGVTTVDSEGKETVKPGKYSTAIYYVPESINYTMPGANDATEDGDATEQTEQVYYLTILLEDTKPGSTAPTFENVAVPNLNSLFRNTYVIVNMGMEEGDIEVFAEIAPWNEKTANGYVSEGNPPSNNPFALRKKW